MGKCCLLPAGLHHTCIVSYPGPPVDTSLTMLLHMMAVVEGAVSMSARV